MREGVGSYLNESLESIFVGKYVLSSGKDSLVKLWEMSTTRCLIAYTGAGATGKQVFSNLLYQDTNSWGWIKGQEIRAVALLMSFILQFRKITLRPFLIIQKIMLCFRMKQLHHYAVGIHVRPPVDNCYPSAITEQSGILYILQHLQHFSHALMILEQGFGLDE